MSSSLKHSKCTACKIFLNKVSGQRKIIKTEDEAEAFSNKLQRSIVINDFLCGRCRIQQYKKSKQDEHTPLEQVIDDLQPNYNDPTFHIQIKSEKQNNDEKIELEIQRTVSTHKYCFVCSRIKDLVVISEEARLQCFTKRKVYIPEGNRCCRSHLIKNRLYDSDIDHIKIYSNSSTLSAKELTKFMGNLSM